MPEPMKMVGLMPKVSSPSRRRAGCLRTSSPRWGEGLDYVGSRVATWAFMSKKGVGKQQKLYAVGSVAHMATLFMLSGGAVPETAAKRIPRWRCLG